ncbi:MAG: VWA domain-containing protein [Pseudomonadota bacterium]
MPDCTRAPRRLRTLNALRLARAFRRDEEGAFLIFSLFLFLGILVIGGMAVDLMRFETRRMEMQNAIDSAVLAAANLEQDIDSVTLVRDFVEKAGIDPDTVNVTTPQLDVVGADPANNNPGTLVARTVRAQGNLDLKTYFMHLSGVDKLRTRPVSAASEGSQNVEISLIVDISGSMDGAKMDKLKTEAKKFFRKVIDEERTVGKTSISIIPYNHTVVVGDDLIARLNADGVVAAVDPIKPYTGALGTYPTEHNSASCVRFEDNAFEWTDLDLEFANLRAIGPNTPLTRLGHFKRGTNSFNKPTNPQRECDVDRAQILVHETEISELDTYIMALRADGRTAIENGMKWGVALLDPAFRPIVNDMVTEKKLPEDVRNRPGGYDPTKTKKYIVLMTDGKNTSQRNLKPEFLNGPSRVWFSAKAGDNNEPGYIVDANKNGNPDRNKEWYDAYYVEMPTRPEAERFLRVHQPGNTSDSVKYGVSELPDDAVQLTNQQLYDRFAEEDIGKFFFEGHDNDTRNAYRDSVVTVTTASEADDRLSALCAAARQGGDITIFTIAFSAPQEGKDAMLDCAKDEAFYFPADDKSLATAFDTIAGAITALRLTQ